MKIQKHRTQKYTHSVCLYARMLDRMNPPSERKMLAWKNAYNMKTFQALNTEGLIIIANS